MCFRDSRLSLLFLGNGHDVTTPYFSYLACQKHKKTPHGHGRLLRAGHGRFGIVGGWVGGQNELSLVTTDEYQCNESSQRTSTSCNAPQPSQYPPNHLFHTPKHFLDTNDQATRIVRNTHLQSLSMLGQRSTPLPLYSTQADTLLTRDPITLTTLPAPQHSMN